MRIQTNGGGSERVLKQANVPRSGKIFHVAKSNGRIGARIEAAGARAYVRHLLSFERRKGSYDKRVQGLCHPGSIQALEPCPTWLTDSDDSMTLKLVVQTFFPFEPHLGRWVPIHQARRRAECPTCIPGGGVMYKSRPDTSYGLQGVSK